MADLEIRPSIKGILLWYALSMILLIGVVAFLASRDFEPVELWALMAFPLGIDLWASLKHIRQNARRLSLQSGILRLEDGLVRKSQRNIVLNKIRDVRVEQSLGQRLFGVGNLSVEAIGDSGTITLENVDGPRKAAEAILDAMRDHRGSHL
jgi:uncharacterized membrane protein YdbT with pleckstrin-like domain